MREFFPIFCNSSWKGSGGEEDVVFFDEGEGVVGEFGLAEAFVAGVVLAVDDANLGVKREHFGGEELVDGFGGAVDGVVGFLDVEVEGVADDFAYGEGHDAV